MTDALVAVVVVAAGSGTRLGASEPKAFVAVGGSTILERALGSVFGMSEPAQVIVVAPAAKLDEAGRSARAVAGAASGYVTVVAGGDTRQESVAAGLAALEPGIEIVLVHDSARAFTPSSQMDAVVATVRERAMGVVPGLPVADTIKRVDWLGEVEQTVDRAPLVAVQTPQGFPRADLVAAYASATESYTDDAALFSAAGHPVITIDGDPLAFKITTPWDLRRAELAANDVSTGGAEVIDFRTGVGMDVHAFDDESPLWLGGLYWPDEPGLAGHSDGDAVCHAVCDALLSAAGLGDIGGRFGVSELRFKNAHGDVFLTETVSLVTGAGFTIGNVAVQVIAAHPKLANRRTEIESHLSKMVGAPVSVSATTSDSLGFTGRAEGLAVIATALLRASHS